MFLEPEAFNEQNLISHSETLKRKIPNQKNLIDSINFVKAVIKLGDIFNFGWSVSFLGKKKN